MGSAEIILAHGVWRVMAGVLTLVPYEISVIGASKSGKTTLDGQLTTRGEIRKLYDNNKTTIENNMAPMRKPKDDHENQ